MARIHTFDHCGFSVQDIPRAWRFYEKILGGKPEHISNLNHNVYEGWPIISFVEMGGHRFELCLAQEVLPEAQTGYPRTGFAVTEENMAKLKKELDEADIPFEGPITYPDAVPIKETIRVRDPEGNLLEFSTRR